MAQRDASLVQQALLLLTWVLDFQIRVTHIGIENRRDSSQVSKWFVCLPFLDIALVV